MLKWKHAEGRRQERVRVVVEEREFLIQQQK
jgi:hypothetical protein